MFRCEEDAEEHILSGTKCPGSASIGRMASLRYLLASAALSSALETAGKLVRDLRCPAISSTGDSAADPGR